MHIFHLCQSPSDRPSLLRPEIKRKIFLVFIVFTQILARLVVHHRQDPCNRLADGVAVRERVSIMYGPREKNSHILVSFDADPPAIFCTRRVRSSFFNSTSCLDKSFFDLNLALESPSSGNQFFPGALGLELVSLDLAGHFGGV